MRLRPWDGLVVLTAACGGPSFPPDAAGGRGEAGTCQRPVSRPPPFRGNSTPDCPGQQSRHANPLTIKQTFDILV